MKKRHLHPSAHVWWSLVNKYIAKGELQFRVPERIQFLNGERRVCWWPLCRKTPGSKPCIAKHSHVWHGVSFCVGLTDVCFCKFFRNLSKLEEKPRPPQGDVGPHVGSRGPCSGKRSRDNMGTWRACPEIQKDLKRIFLYLRPGAHSWISTDIMF